MPKDKPDKQVIMENILRLSLENNGRTPGQGEFEKATGIARSEWRGVYWANWTDAVKEVGLKPNTAPEGFSQEDLLKELAELTNRLGHFPRETDLRMKDAGPSRSAYRRHLGARANRISLLRDFCRRKGEYSRLLGLLPEVEKPVRDASGDSTKREGYVYMFRSGRYYKIGKTFDPIRRLGEVKLQLPEGAEPVHHFQTDDPSGIEKYWHERFKDKREKGEFFKLSSADVRAFKRRKKFM